MKKNERLLGVAVRGILAASAAALVMSAPAFAQTGTTPKAGDQVACYGVNACKGKGACKTMHSSCAGKNTCKGHGMMKMSKEECMKKGGTLEEAKEEMAK